VSLEALRFLMTGWSARADAVVYTPANADPSTIIRRGDSARRRSKMVRIAKNNLPP